MTNLSTIDKDSTRQNLILWTANTFANGLPTVTFNEVMTESRGLKKWLENIACYGLGMVSNTPHNRESTRALVERVAYIRMDIFGGLADSDMSEPHADSAYANGYLAAHTDGTYAYDPPGLILFHVLDRDYSGGESIFIDGFYAAETLRQLSPDAFSLLTQVDMPGHYLEVDTHLETRQPLIQLDPENQVKRIRFNHMDRAPFYWGEKTTQVYEALWEWRKIIDDLANQYRFRLTPGNVLLFDNWRLLHGRLAYVGERRMVNCYLNMEDFESRLRGLRATL
ncbi:TauD/TfdA family dioxygenase [Coleofasciculus sp. F4-SAH-05]|uniref:TauD/TfdA family dioxygenase n=1 Tax=Coleofasciculus TaxID=669368 RepID=UPI0032F7528E